MTKAHHVCILGCGRSGTSILGELFQSVPSYRYFSEPLLSEVPTLDLSSPVAIKVPRPGPDAAVSPGLPFLWPEFLKMFPTPPLIIWQVRHPLDTICSLKVGISRNWGHHPRPPHWQQWLQRPLVEQCAYHWNYLNTAGYDRLKPVALVSGFEKMIKDPLGHARHMLQAAAIDVNGCMEEMQQWANRVQDRNNDLFQEADCSKPYSTNDHVRKVGRWRENLSQQEVRQALPLIRNGARLFNYELPIPDVKPKDQ